jgi:hypothetical protein
MLEAVVQHMQSAPRCASRMQHQALVNIAAPGDNQLRSQKAQR